MARATRSTAQIDKDKQQDSAPAPRKTGTKKRKRNSNADNDGQPATKQFRTDGSQEPLDLDEQPADVKETDSRGSGDVPIDPADAQKILDVLEMVDTQGLLDRVFPLPTEPPEATSPDAASTPSISTQTFSFRALLKDSSNHPLRVLRSAVQHLFPISSHPRSRPSAPAAQQLSFCNLALSLLDLASFHSVPTPLEVESIWLSDTVEGDVKPLPSSSPTRNRKYALVQRLPTGDWWTSLNSEFTPTSADGRELKDLPTAHAELAAILPSASTPGTYPDKTLAAYVSKKPRPSLQQVPGPRRVSCGKFLDYGPYASFAPSFDQDGVEVGRDTLGEVIYHQREGARLREKAKGKQKALSAPGADIIMSAETHQGEQTATEGRREASDDQELESALASLFPPEEVAAIKSAMGSLELEQAVQELLDRNSRALLRLQRLQRERLGAEGGGSSTVAEGSEEWDTAQAIIDSLVLLASLRPRSSSDDESKSPPFIPSAPVLRMLQRTLPVGATQGWYGTLPPGRTTALRDDTTVEIKAGVPVALPPTTATAAAAAVVTPAKPVATATPYTPYNYSNYQGSPYRGGYGTYTPGQASAYYPNYAAPSQGQAAGGAQYPQQQYNGQYPYSSWYNYQQHATPAPQTPAGNNTSDRVTPQPATPAAIATNYASFFASTAQQPQPQRAVANTVVTPHAAKAYQPGTWTGGQPAQGYVPPTLPPHLRTNVGGGNMPGTPQPVTAGNSTYPPHPGYYGNYQPAPAAR